MFTDWQRFRVAVASAITPHQVAELLMHPMTVEGPLVISGIVRMTRPAPLDDVTFEFRDHLTLSMYGATSSQSSVRDYHVAVACALIEYEVLRPNHGSYDLACPLGLLLLASFDHPDVVQQQPLSDVIRSLVPAAQDKQASAELLAAASVAKLFDYTPKKNKKHVYTPKKSNKKHPRKDQIAEAVSSRVRELLANGDIDTGSPSSVTSVFWDWLGDKNALTRTGEERKRR
jgi:hypothetical protein